MLIINTREFRESQKKYFELAEKQQVFIKRGNKMFELKPVEKEGNPHPDGDPFFEDKNNVVLIAVGVEQAKSENTIKLTISEVKKLLGL